jgi:DNA-binding CsgD family transcriptional regulator
VRSLSLAIAEAARASTLDELGLYAFPALAQALDATPAFLAEARADLSRSVGIAGDLPAFQEYVRDYVLEDPIGTAAILSEKEVIVFEQFSHSRAYSEFHRVHDFEHHMLVRFHGDRITTDGALAMGFTRGKNQPAFGEREAELAELALPAFYGAAERILGCCLAGFAERKGLTPAEIRVLSVLAQGLSNQQIGRQLALSVDTVKTHLSRIFRKLEVRSRAEALVVLRRGR